MADPDPATADVDRELEEWTALAARRGVRRVRVVGALSTGAAFLATLLLVPEHTSATAWGLALLAAAAVVLAWNVAVRVAARPGRPEPGRLTADYLVLAGGGMTFAVLGWPVMDALGLFSDGF